jgi:hypothetical protein
MLSDQDVVRIIRRHIESKFPKDCARCGRRYESLAEYLLQTTHVGEPITGDNPLADVQPIKLVGTISYANCSCGSTLGISSAGMDILTMWRLLRWAGASMSRRGLSIGAVLSDLRSRIDEEVLREHHARDRHANDPPQGVAPLPWWVGPVESRPDTTGTDLLRRPLRRNRTEEPIDDSDPVGEKQSETKAQ